MKRITAFILALLMICILFAGCAQNGITEIHDPASITSTVPDDDSAWNDEGFIDIAYLDEGAFIDLAPEMVPLAGEAPFVIPVPAAPGTLVKKNDKAAIDYSNAKDGYVMVKYIPKDNKVIKVVIKGPGEQYQYNLKGGDTYEVFPLSDLNGKYTISVVEALDGGKAAMIVAETVDATLTDEFAPFVRPNQFVNYSKDSQAVKKAAELVKDSKTTLDKVSAVYNYVIKNLTYDKEKAKNPPKGYVPDVDAVLKAGKGICFDYASLMAAMLRSQNVPVKLVVGWTGDVYHAWLNVYSAESGWVNSVVQFDGKKWKLMDPTFASTGNQSADVMKHIGDGKNYTAKFLY